MKPAPTAAAMKVKMLRDSMRCFVCGMLSLIPAVGLIFAIAALGISGSVRAKEKQFWNAARPYRIVGTLCAALMTVVWFFLISLIIYHATVPSN